jgi:hypothetical protein
VGADGLVRARSERLHRRDLEPTANALIRYGSVVVLSGRAVVRTVAMR